MSSQGMKKLAESISLVRLGAPEDVAKAIYSVHGVMILRDRRRASHQRRPACV